MGLPTLSNIERMSVADLKQWMTVAARGAGGIAITMQIINEIKRRGGWVEPTGGGGGTGSPKTNLSGFDLWKAQNYQNMLSLYNGPVGYNKIYDFDTFLQEMYKASQQKVGIPEDSSTWKDSKLPGGYNPGYPTPTTGSDGWPLYPPPPVTNPPTPGWKPDENTMDPRTLPAWLFEQFPENYSYYDNLSKGLLDESWQLQRQAMQVFNQRQKEMSQLFNSETAALKGTIADRTAKLDAALADAESRQNAGIATMGEGVNTYQRYLNEAMSLQNEALRANPLKYQHYIDTGTLPEEVDSTLRTLRDQTIASTRAELDRQKAQANAALKQRMSAMGMQDSEYAAIQNARLAGEAGRTMAETIEKQNAGYLQARLQQPYEMQKAAVSTMQSYNPFIGNILAGGAQQGSNLQNMGKTQVDAATAMGQLQNNAFSNVVGAANSAYGNIMQAGHNQMQYPQAMFQMATALPGNALNARQGYLDTMLNVWKTVLNNDFSNAQLQAQKDANEGSWWDMIFG